jgi:uncharacterized protein YutE (UPF0331/DUF86 family)
MTYLVERLAELRKHLRHLRELQPRVPDAAALERDLSLHNDVLYSLLSICQLVIDLSGELSSRKERAFADYTESIRNLRLWPDFDEALIEELERLPGFRNVLIHEYVAFDLERAVEALRNLEPVERFVGVVATIEAQDPRGA